MPRNCLFSSRLPRSETQIAFDDPLWDQAHKVRIDVLWDGRAAGWAEGGGNLSLVQSAWSAQRVYFRFQCLYDSLNVDPSLGLAGPIDHLWTRDVVEVFLQPRLASGYFEIDVSPLGQWLDLRVIEPRKNVDFRWESHLTAAVDLRREETVWEVLLSIPFDAMQFNDARARPPEGGEVWRVNFSRVAGPAASQEFLSWRPTFSPTPDFHVPGAFGHLFFID